MRYVVESVEDEIVLLKDCDGNNVFLPVNNFEFKVRCGMTVLENNGIYTFDTEDEEQRRKRIAEKRNKLLGRKSNAEKGE